MPDDQQSKRHPAATAAKTAPPDVSSQFDRFEKRQRELWRLTFLLLLILAAGFALVSWSAIKEMAVRYEPLLPLLFLIVILFIAYAWKRNREIYELRGLLRGLGQRDSAGPSDQQLDQLFEIIARSQQGYRDLIDSFDDVLLALSLDGEIRAVNRSFSDLVSAPFQQIIGKRLEDFVQEANGEATQMFKQAMPRFLERRHWAGAIQIRFKGRGNIYYFDCVAHAMTRAEKVHGITVLARDVTALRKNEARFTELFESLHEGIYIATPEGAIIDVNPALVRMLGYDSKSEVLQRNVEEILVDRDARKAFKEQVERQTMPQGREIILVRKDGTSIVCFSTATAVRDAGGNVLRYQGAVMDITERRDMERKLHQQQEFARRLVDSFPDLILVLDTSAHYTFISPSIKDVLGFDADETPDMILGDRTHTEDRPALRSLFDEILAGRQSFASLEVRVRHKQGDWRRLRCHFSALHSETGAIEGVVISGRDVTELKRLEEQLIQAEKLAAMGQMLAGVAHELNNPLTAILGVTELLRERQGFEDAAKRQLELTHRQARRAARIVQNLLEFSRPASPQKKSLDVNSVIERTVQLHEHSLRRNAVEVDFRPQPGIPGVVGDANQLIQVFLNLVTNAEQAIREVRDTGRIQIRIARVEDRVCISLQDDGVGIKPEAIPRIFDPFYTTKRPGGGTGLGLSICMSIVREHGGTIEAEALPGGGSAFLVYLPVAQQPFQLSDSASAFAASTGSLESISASSAARTSTLSGVSGGVPGEESPRATGPLGAPAPATTLRGRAILVLDDEESIRMLLEEGLAAQGMQVYTAGSAEEALRLAAERSYDAFLCDLNLSAQGPAASGRESAARILAAAPKPAPVLIYITGEYVEDAASASPNEPRRLQKPFRVSDVVAVLQQLLPPNSN